MCNNNYCTFDYNYNINVEAELQPIWQQNSNYRVLLAAVQPLIRFVITIKSTILIMHNYN